jgi:hypothetical protein
MNRKWLLILLAGVLFLGIVVVHWVDRFRSASNLRVTYILRDTGDHCFSILSNGFEMAGWTGASMFTEGLDFKTWAKATEVSATQPPMLFGKDRGLALSIAAKQYAALAREPRGTWLTYTHEIAEARSRLDAAIIAVETEDVSSGAVTNRRAESKAEIVRVARTILDAQEKAAKAEEGSGISDEQRHAATTRNLAEITDATPAEQTAIAAELCRKAGRSNCGPPGSEKADAEIVANWRVRSGLAPAPTPALTRK